MASLFDPYYSGILVENVVMAVIVVYSLILCYTKAISHGDHGVALRLKDIVCILPSEVSCPTN